MSKIYIVKIFTIAFFVGLNMVLGVYFLATVRGSQFVPTEIKEKLNKTGLVDFDADSAAPTEPAADYSLRIDLQPESVIEGINAERVKRNNSVLAPSAKLHKAALALLEELKRTNFIVDDSKGDELLRTVLKDQTYSYSVAYQSVVIGPVNSQAVIDYWLQDSETSLFQADVVTEVGVATTVETVDGQFTGITAVLLAKPLVSTTNSSTPKSIPAIKPTLPLVSDDQVITALNEYRKVHNVAPLQVNDQLCSYAQKRVADLVAFGGLDNHKGFQADFADSQQRPVQLKEYPGGTIGENLAHQFCKNMTTGQSFIAETGTALIEWCFDSSTKGHREAQLSATYKNVCIRHADGMYVVTFGD